MADSGKKSLVVALAGIVALPWLAACNTTATRGEAALNELVAMLPGTYDNIAQSRAAPDHSALRLAIALVQAPLVGDHVFYVQEMAANDPRRVLSQRLYVLNAVPDSESTAMTQLDFTEPARWRDGHLNRDLFRGLLMQDLKLRTGCDLVWKRATNGFTASNDPGRCRTNSRDTGETLKVEQKVELDADGLAIFDQRRDAAGVVVQGGEADPYYRFSRRAETSF
jgi:hypothetical protein